MLPTDRLLTRAARSRVKNLAGHARPFPRPMNERPHERFFHGFSRVQLSSRSRINDTVTEHDGEGVVVSLFQQPGTAPRRESLRLPAKRIAKPVLHNPTQFPLRKSELARSEVILALECRAEHPRV